MTYLCLGVCGKCLAHLRFLKFDFHSISHLFAPNLGITIVWTISIRSMTCFYSVSNFSESSLHKPNSKKNKLRCTNEQPQRGDMSIETTYPQDISPSGAICLFHQKIVQTLVGINIWSKK